MKCRAITFFVTITLLPLAQGQQPQPQQGAASRINGTAGKVLATIQKKSNDEDVFNERSENVFLPYEGKIIRKIYIDRLGFDRSMLDTARKVKTFVSKAANYLHNDTKARTVRDNLFIKEGKPLNPY
jgi:hypothetical protein